MGFSVYLWCLVDRRLKIQ